MASAVVFRQFLAILMLFVLIAAVGVLATTEDASDSQRRELQFGGVVPDGDSGMLYGLPPPMADDRQ